MPERTRVLHLVKGLGPGGAERLLVELMGARDAAAFDHRVAYALPHKSHLVADLEAQGVPVACLGSAWPLRLRRRLADVDVAHAHSPLLATAARLAARTLPGPRRPVTVSTEHNTWRAYAVATRVANALTFLLDAHHFAVSRESASSIWPPLRRRTEVLVHGVDVPAVVRHRQNRGATRAALGLSDEDVAVVTVANYRREKDHATLLRAARRVRDARPTSHVRFFVVGQGPLGHEVEALHAALGLAGTVILLGYRPDALDVVAAADLFVLSSTHEGLPVALMEALVLGVPVVATAVGGIPEALGPEGAGVLVAPGDDVALADAVSALADDEPRRRAMGRAASARGLAFDARVSAGRLEAVYASVAPRRRPREAA